MGPYTEKEKEVQLSLKEKLQETKDNLPTMSNEDLLDEFIRANSVWEDYSSRSDYVYWSQEAEDYAKDIYFAIWWEAVSRMNREGEEE